RPLGVLLALGIVALAVVDQNELVLDVQPGVIIDLLLGIDPAETGEDDRCLDLAGAMPWGRRMNSLPSLQGITRFEPLNSRIRSSSVPASSGVTTSSGKLWK